MSPEPVSVRLREMASQASKECAQLEGEMKEIDILFKQTSSEIEKLTQRQTDSAGRLRQVEANIENYPRTEIKSAYAGALDAQMRLFMMRSQLEQLQTKQRTLQRMQSQLDRLGSMAGEAAEAVSEDPITTVSEAPTADNRAIVAIIEAQEAERQRLSRAMHDGPAQSMTNLILQAEIVERIFEHDPAQAREALSSLKTSANTTFQRIRDFIFDLRPMMLDDLGLIPTLKRYLQTLEQKSHLTAPLIVQGERTMSPYVEVTIFRTIQELLSNAARHAHGSRVQVSLDLQNNPIAVTVEDDGGGFDIPAVLGTVRQKGTSGLANMEKRIGMLGGKIHFSGGVGKGTKVRVEIPA